ncbi:hypothetical protein NQ315_000407 [Exocentrus adspersus]|uniref:Protein sleepless n=1 Tax=Exocentrus adspersus TaxID=1586481 RepID=A0AAV8VMV0_9CUCU|nr:hypothetical protein NQ315_000407 [Exocentrus adspersus]
MKLLFCGALVIYVLALNFHSGSSLQCFFCGSETGKNEDCEVNVNTNTTLTRNCTNEETHCGRAIINSTITRDCAVSQACKIAQSEVVGLKECSLCQTDLCNGAMMATTPLSIHLGVFLFIYYTFTKLLL